MGSSVSRIIKRKRKDPITIRFESHKTHKTKTKRDSQEELEEEEENNQVEDINEGSIIEDNKDQYFSKEDLKKLTRKFPNWRKHSLTNKMRPRQKKFKWKDGELLGTGSFGRVTMGLNIQTGAMMAVKQVHIGPSQPASQQEKIKALEIEIELLSQLSHKNIVRYYGSEKTKTTFNIFLEYISGGTIASVIQQYGSLSENLARVYTKQILEGLEYLHVRNTIHRDIKGANVLVDNNGVCKLADFGTAKRISNIVEGELRYLPSIKGTINWMAPEVIKQTTLSRSSDIWSVGCTVLEMLTGKIPWAGFLAPGATQVSALYQIANAKTPPPFPDELSPAAKDFLLQCFQRDPAERPNVLRLLSHPFITSEFLERPLPMLNLEHQRSGHSDRSPISIRSNRQSGFSPKNYQANSRHKLSVSQFRGASNISEKTPTSKTPSSSRNLDKWNLDGRMLHKGSGSTSRFGSKILPTERPGDIKEEHNDEKVMVNVDSFAGLHYEPMSPEGIKLPSTEQADPQLRGSSYLNNYYIPTGTNNHVNYDLAKYKKQPSANKKSFERPDAIDMEIISREKSGNISSSTRRVKARGSFKNQGSIGSEEEYSSVIISTWGDLSRGKAGEPPSNYAESSSFHMRVKSILTGHNDPNPLETKGFLSKRTEEKPRYATPKIAREEKKEDRTKQRGLFRFGSKELEENGEKKVDRTKMKGLFNFGPKEWGAENNEPHAHKPNELRSPNHMPMLSNSQMKSHHAGSKSISGLPAPSAISEFESSGFQGLSKFSPVRGNEIKEIPEIQLDGARIDQEGKLVDQVNYFFTPRRVVLDRKSSRNAVKSVDKRPSRVRRVEEVPDNSYNTVSIGNINHVSSLKGQMNNSYNTVAIGNLSQMASLPGQIDDIIDTKRHEEGGIMVRSYGRRTVKITNSVDNMNVIKAR